jgi:hypothetical protein
MIVRVVEVEGNIVIIIAITLDLHQFCNHVSYHPYQSIQNYNHIYLSDMISLLMLCQWIIIHYYLVMLTKYIL